MKDLTNQQRLFMDWTVIQDNNQHINASDAELEEMYGTPKRGMRRPNVDFDRFINQIPKGK